MNTATQRNLQQYIDHEVIDQSGSKVGKLHCLWAGPDGEPLYLGVQTGWLFGKTHVVPAQGVEVNEATQTIRLPYSADKINDAPSYDTDREIDERSEREILAYYGISSPASQRATQPQSQTTAQKQSTGRESATVQLHEEQVKVGKREVEAGGIRLRKVVRTETVNQPVELRREEIEIERVPAEGQQSQAGTGQAFQQQDIFIPLRREEAVVQKDSRVREEVRVSKKSETERQTISENVRKEDVEIEEQGEARRADPKTGDARREMREREEQPRSQRRQKPC
jgi:uncharacterized protein (TIGR02271 family)